MRIVALAILVLMALPASGQDGVLLDAQDWLVDVEALLDSPAHVEADWSVSRGAPWSEADTALGLHLSCDTYYDGTSLVHDPARGEDNARRGFLEAIRLGQDEGVVVVQCDFWAYQGSYVLVHVDGDRAVVYEAPVAPGETDLHAAVLPTPSIDVETRTLSTFLKARGPADCGTYARYRLGDRRQLRALEVRQQDCLDDGVERAPGDVDSWPVIYSAPD